MYKLQKEIKDKFAYTINKTNKKETKISHQQKFNVFSANSGGGGGATV